METDPLIIFGSKARPQLPVLKWIPTPVVLVEPQDMPAYVAARKERGSSEELVELPENNRGFAYMMNQCVAETLRRGKKWFFFSDDDVTALQGRSQIDHKLVKLIPSEVQGWIRLLQARAEANNLSQLAVSFAGQAWAAKRDLDAPAGAWGVHLSKAEDIQMVGGYDESLAIFNDWEISARLLQWGFRTARTNLVAFVHKMMGMSGGAEEIYRRKESIREAAESIASRYPGIATVKFVEAHGIHEVRFNWKKLGPTAPKA